MKTLSFTLILLLLGVLGTSGQTTKTVGANGADYTTLKAAFDAINLGTISGAITLQIIDNTTETASAVLNASGSGSANYSSVNIYPTASGKIISGNLGAPLIDLNGADHVTIDGRYNSVLDLTITNTSISSIVGSATSTLRFINDATNNVVKYCNIKGSEGVALSGIILFSTTDGTTGNDSNTIDHNTITSATSRPRNVIYSAGTSEKENTRNNISNNAIFDFFNLYFGLSGINLGVNNSEWLISGNSFYETTTIVTTFTSASNVISISNSGSGYTISDNYIGGSAPFCGGSALTKTSNNNNFTAINLSVANSPASSIQNNTIQNINWSNSGEANWAGISTAAGGFNIGTIKGNLIGASSGTGSIIVNNGATGANIYGINITGSGTIYCQNNSIGAIIAVNSSTNASNIYGISKTNTSTCSIGNNLVGSLTTPYSIQSTSTSTGNNQIVCGINISAGNSSTYINQNIIANLYNGSTNSTESGLGAIYGINAAAGTLQITNNQIRNLSIANANSSATHTASVGGIVYTGVSALSKNISGNTVSNLTNDFPSFKGSVIGLYYGSASESANTVSDNYIHSLNISNPDPLSTVFGIKIAAGEASYYNNVISLGNNTATTIFGIYEFGTGNNSYYNNIYFNTIYIGGTPNSGSLNSYSLYSSGTVNTKNFRNNLLVNRRSNIGATGKHYAAWLDYSSSVLLTLDYNNYYVNAASGGVLGYYNGSDVTSLPLISGKDANSLNIDPLYRNAGGTIATDYITSATLQGTSIGGITTDYPGLNRALPKIGAIETNSTNILWTGDTNTDWNTSTNWSDNAVPTAGINVAIVDVPNDPLVNAASGNPAVCNNLTLSAGALLTIPFDKSLTVNGTFINNSAVNGLLIQSTSSGTGSLITNSSGVSANVQRYMTGNKWHQVTGPVSQNVVGFMSANNSAIPSKDPGLRGLMEFNTIGNVWDAYGSIDFGSSSFASGQGFMLRTTSDVAVNFSGTLNAGTVQVAVDNTGNRWNCIGNPYSSAISLNTLAGGTNFYTTNESLFEDSYKAFYIWDESGTPMYKLINNADPASYAQSGQGFFVRAKTGATGNIQFTQGMQVHQNAVALKSAEISFPEIKLSAVRNGQKVSTSIKFIEGMHPGLDIGYDAGIMKADPDFSIHTRLVADNGVEFMLQCLAPEAMNDVVIPVGLDCTLGGDLTLSAEIINIPDRYSLILEDKQTKLKTDLRSSGYTAIVESNTIASTRFILHLSSEKTGVDRLSKIEPFARCNKGILTINNLFEGNSQVDLFDLSGRHITARQLSNSGLVEFELDPKFKGIYLIKLSSSKEFRIGKVVIQ